MGYEDSVDEVIGQLRTTGAASDHVVSEALALAIAAWPVLAEARPGEAWDLFGLDVTAATELLEVAVTRLPRLDMRDDDVTAVRLAVLRLVAALMDSLMVPGPIPGLRLASRLAGEAAAVQLRRALDAVT